MITIIGLLLLGFLLGFVVEKLTNRKPLTKEQVMAAIDDLKSAIARLEAVRDETIACLPPDHTSELIAVSARVEAVSDSLEKAVPPCT